MSVGKAKAIQVTSNTSLCVTIESQLLVVTLGKEMVADDIMLANGIHESIVQLVQHIVYIYLGE